MAKYPGVSISVIRRLPRYYRFLGELLNNGMERISSREFAQITGLTASQIRQDLNCFGGFGQQGYGYNIASLRAEIGRILAVEKKRPAILIGAGNLGLALVNHVHFEQRGFSLIGIFDNNPEKVGQKINEFTIMNIVGLEEFCEKNAPQAAILCIPKQAAAGISDILVSRGVKGFWNFSHYDLAIQYGDKIAVENVHLGDSLMTLSFNVNEVSD